MDETKAMSIVSALANGVNPLTGEVFPTDSPYQTAEVVRALFLATQILESRQKTRPKITGADNAGKPWSVDEDRRLLTAFESGTGITDLARAHGRTPAGIQARLEKHGRIAPSESAARRYHDGPRARPSTG